MHALLLRPLPYPQAGRIVTIESLRGGQPGKLTPREWEELSRDKTIFESVAGWYPSQYNFGGDSQPAVFTACMTTASLFDVFGLPPAHGTAWDDAQHRRTNPVLVMSDALWRNRFGADPALVGRTLSLDFAPYRVTGIASPAFDFPAGIDLYRAANLGGAQNWEVRSLFIVARLQPDVSSEQAALSLKAFAARMEADFPATNRGVGFHVTPLRDSLVGPVKSYLLLTLSLSAAVLLIAVVNVANLMLSRGLARQKEIVIRAALGATPFRLALELLREGLLLSLLGGAAGVALAYWWMSLLKTLLRLNLPAWMDVQLDTRVLLFALLVSLIAGALVTLVPALSAARTDLTSLLGEGARGSSGGVAQSRLRAALVVSELALATTLLIVAALLVISYQRVQRVDPGFQSARLLTFHTDPPWSRYNTAAQTSLFYRLALEKLNALPGVEAASNHSLPLATNQNYGKPVIEAEGQGLDQIEQNPYVNVQIVSPNYFRVMGVPMWQGRAFSAEDHLASTPAAILSRPVATRLFGAANPTGKRVRMRGMLGSLTESQQSWFTVIGVAEGVRGDSLLAPPGMDVYLSDQQQFAGDSFFVLRSARPAFELEREAARSIREIDPAQPIFDVRTMDDRIQDGVWQRRLAGRLSLLFGVLAILLAGVGVYSVIAYGVSRRTREMGIRLALGATPGQVRRAVLAQGLRLALLGAVAGAAMAAALGGAIGSLLHATHPWDATVYAGSIALVSCLSALACYLPARRASEADPAATLRQE